MSIGEGNHLRELAPVAGKGLDGVLLIGVLALLLLIAIGRDAKEAVERLRTHELSGSGLLTLFKAWSLVGPSSAAGSGVTTKQAEVVRDGPRTPSASVCS